MGYIPSSFALSLYRKYSTPPYKRRGIFSSRPGIFFRRLWFRLFHWEFWPSHIFYFPVYLWSLFQVLRYRSFFLFTSVNPSILYSGMLGGSKKDIYDILPREAIPKTVFLSAPLDAKKVRGLMQAHEITYPIILKPDDGLRGWRVAKLMDDEALEKYINEDRTYDVLLQEYVDYPLELGVFYYKIPGDSHGLVSSVCFKIPLGVLGDGIHNVRTLMEGNDRTCYYLPVVEKNTPNILSHVPAAGEIFPITRVFNHARGAIFLDGREVITPAFTAFFDRLVSRIPGFYYGRFDILCRSPQDIALDKHVKVIELNGASSELGHIYHPKTSLLQAYKDVFSHMFVMLKIALLNKEYQKKYKLSRFFKDLWDTVLRV